MSEMVVKLALFDDAICQQAVRNKTAQDPKTWEQSCPCPIRVFYGVDSNGKRWFVSNHGVTPDGTVGLVGDAGVGTLWTHGIDNVEDVTQMMADERTPLGLRALYDAWFSQGLLQALLNAERSP